MVTLVDTTLTSIIPQDAFPSTAGGGCSLYGNAGTPELHAGLPGFEGCGPHQAGRHYAGGEDETQM